MGNSNWEIYTLGDLTENLDAIRVPVKEPDRKTGQYPYYGASGVIDMVDGYLFDGEYLLVAEDGENLRSRKTPIAFIATGKFWVNNHAHIVRGNEKANTKFLMYYLSQTDISGFLTGSTIPKLTQDNLNRILIYAPHLTEQRAIAGTLSALDDKIELNRRMNRTLESMARAVFRQWFVESEDSKDWQEHTLQQHVEAEKGLSYKGEGLSKDGGTPMHNLNSVYEGGGYKYEGIKYYTGEYRERHILRAGDIIVTNTEQGFEYLLIGFPAIVPKHFGTTGIFTHHIFRVRPLPTSPIKTHYLYFLLMNPLVREQIIGCTNGTTVNMLSADGLRTPKFKLPPKELIDKFEQFAVPIFEKMELLYEESRTLASLRDYLLPRLMRGEIRVKDE